MNKFDYNIFDNAGVLNNYLLAPFGVYDSVGTLRTIQEGDFSYDTAGNLLPLIPFDNLPFGASVTGASMTLLYSYNDKLLTDNPNCAGVGSSTIANFGLTSPNGYGHRLNTRVNLVGIGTKTFTNFGLGGQSSTDILNPANTANNLQSALATGARLIFWDEPTNWVVAGLTVAQQITNLLAAVNMCWARGAFLWGNGSRPRDAFNSTERQKLKDLDAAIRIHPILKYHFYPCYYDFAAPGDDGIINPVLGQGDGIHLNATGTQLLESNSYTLMLRMLKARTAFNAYVIERSPVGAGTYTTFDTITDTTLISKTYTKQSGDYRVRGRLKNNTFTDYSDITTITNETPTVSATTSTPTVTLPSTAGSLSSTANDPDGTIVTRLWTKTSGPSATINTPSTANSTVTLTTAGTYVFRMTVTDNEGVTSFSEATITVNAAGNVNPTAAAGADQIITLPTTTASLSGSGSSDPDGTIVAYAWSQTGGPVTAGITSASTVSTGVTGLVSTGVYTFQLQVTDDDGGTATDSMTVTVNPVPARRVLVDLGGDGIENVSGVPDTGVMTPNNAVGSGNPGQDGTGKWWNNMVNGNPGTWLNNPLDTLGNPVTGFSVTVDKLPSGTFFIGGDSINYGGQVVAVGDYPSTAVRDNVFYSPTAGIVAHTFTIPAGLKMSVKFWGNRDAAAPRILQLKLSTDASFTQEFETAGNTNYNQAVTYTNLTGTVIIQSQVKSGSLFGYLSVWDFTFETA